MINDEEDKKMLNDLAKLDAATQEHFKLMVRAVARCFTRPEECYGMMVLSIDNDIFLKSMNASAEETAELAFSAASALGQIVTESAPPRAQFN